MSIYVCCLSFHIAVSMTQISLLRPVNIPQENGYRTLIYRGRILFSISTESTDKE